MLQGLNWLGLATHPHCPSQKAAAPCPGLPHLNLATTPLCRFSKLSWVSDPSKQLSARHWILAAAGPARPAGMRASCNATPRDFRAIQAPIEPRGYIITACPIGTQEMLPAAGIPAALAVCNGLSNRNYGASDLLLRHSLCPCSPESTRCRSFDQVTLVHGCFVARMAAAFSKLGWKRAMTTAVKSRTRKCMQTP